MKWLTLFTLVLPAVLSVLGFFYSSLPSYAGKYYLQALNGQVQISRDGFAVPFITAGTKGDALFAQGFVHAQDRLWAMDILRRTALGRLSELLGPDALEIDTFARNIEINRLSAKALGTLKASVLSDLQRYADGVNTFVRKQRILPSEYILTWTYFEEWKPQDSVAILQLLGVNWGFEFLRYHLSKLVGREVVDVLLPADLGKNKRSFIISDEELPRHLRVDQEFQTRKQPEIPVTGSNVRAPEGQSEVEVNFGGGSNAWAVSGKHTKSGKPILANDTHLATRVPALWYLITLKTSQVTVSGASVPGVPGVLSGRNDALGWTLTLSTADTVDFYLEKRNPANPLESVHSSGTHPITTFEEIIQVKGHTIPHTVLFERTIHGPVLKDYENGPMAFNTHFIPKGVDTTIALKWSLSVVDDTSMEGILSLFEAANVTQFRNALSKLACCSLGVVYATVSVTQLSDEIGFQLTGRIPNTSNRAYFSNAPLDGWLPENEWVGILDFADLPYVLNPVEGFIIAANNA